MTLIVHHAFGFSTAGSPPLKQPPSAVLSSKQRVALNMGLFDGIAKAFSNEEFKAQDQWVRASHILIKGDDVEVQFAKVKEILGELDKRVQQEPDNLLPIFAEIARRESQCPSSAQGGDLGIFGPGKMVKDFDAVLFPEDVSSSPPPHAGSVIGPVVTDFGCHVILVTERKEDRNQVEEKLARIDPDARV